MNFADLTAGTGGASFGLEAAGLKCVLQVDHDPDMRMLLSQNWPGMQREFQWAWSSKELTKPDIVIANDKGFKDGERSEGGMATYKASIRILKPRWAILETGKWLLSEPHRWWLRDLFQVLSGCGMDVTWFPLSPCAFGAPLTHCRLYVVAFPHALAAQVGHPGPEAGDVRWPYECHEGWEARLGQSMDPDPRTGRMPVRVPRRLADAVGRSSFPCVYQWLGRKIIEAEETLKGA